MRLEIDGLLVYFPYPKLFKEQYEYMVSLKKVLDASSSGILEMPTGTGKTATLLSFIISYQLAHPENFRKLVYCTRTFTELEKTLKELRFVVDGIKLEMKPDELKTYELRAEQFEKEYLKTIATNQEHETEQGMIQEGAPADIQQGKRVKFQKGKKGPGAVELNMRNGEQVDTRTTRTMTGQKILGLGLSARRALCIHKTVSSMVDREKVDAGCRSLTATFIRVQAMSDPESGIETCSYYESFQDSSKEIPDMDGIYSLDDLRSFGRQHNLCPYFLARHMIREANVVVCNYPYVIDNRVSSVIYDKKQLGENAIVVFDEAHNIDNICVDSMSFKLNKGVLEAATANLQQLEDQVVHAKGKFEERLKQEYTNLVNQLKEDQAKKVEQNLQTKQQASGSSFSDLVPGNIRKPENFIGFLKRVLIALKKFLKVKEVVVSSPKQMIDQFINNAMLDKESLSLASMRLRMLFDTMMITSTDEMSNLDLVAEFISIASTNTDGFKVILEPYQDASTVIDPQLQLCCLDPRIAMEKVKQYFKSVVFTSGTMTPLNIYPKLLGMQKEITVLKSHNIYLPRNSIHPLIVTRGKDQVNLTSEFQERGNKQVSRNYGEFLLNLCKMVPDGMVVFFPSYSYMRDIILEWVQMGIIEEIFRHKLILVETKEIKETLTSIKHYQYACKTGRGAILFAVARGKVAEGVDFKNHLGRCVVMIGIPFQYSRSKPLICRMEYAEEHFGISQKDFITFDAMRQCSQCLGRVIRNKDDWGLMILADKRYSKNDKHTKLPNWIKQQLGVQDMNVQTDVALAIARQYFKDVAQDAPIGKDFYFDESDFPNVQD